MIWVLISIIVGSVALDQLTKWLTVVYLEHGETVPLWKGVFHFTHAQNTGAAWGILKDDRWLFMIFSTMAIIALSVYLFGFCKQSKWMKIAISMIIGGGIGNMIDRVLLGHVTDFLDFRLIDFPIFNVADCFITIGSFTVIGFLIRDTILEIKQERLAKRAGQSSDGSSENGNED